MEEKKKKKLTLSVSSKTLHNVPNYEKSRQKTFVVFLRETTFVENFFLETYPQEVFFRPVKHFFSWMNLTP